MQRLWGSPHREPTYVALDPTRLDPSDLDRAPFLIEQPNAFSYVFVAYAKPEDMKNASANGLQAPRVRLNLRRSDGVALVALREELCVYLSGARQKQLRSIDVSGLSSAVYALRAVDHFSWLNHVVAMSKHPHDYLRRRYIPRYPPSFSALVKAVHNHQPWHFGAPEPKRSRPETSASPKRRALRAGLTFIPQESELALIASILGSRPTITAEELKHPAQAQVPRYFEDVACWLRSLTVAIDDLSASIEGRRTHTLRRSRPVTVRKRI